MIGPFNMMPPENVRPLPRYDFAHVTGMRPEERIVSMVNYKNMIIVATERNIYALKDGKIGLLDFEIQEICRK